LEEELKPILISWRNNEKERKLAKYIRNKPCYTAWAKEAMFEKMEKEENEKMKNTNPFNGRLFNGIHLNEDIM
jgi:hypothetical protein